jgi:hypothetical protein
MIVGSVEYFIDCGTYVRPYDAVVCNPVKCAEVCETCQCGPVTLVGLLILIHVSRDVTIQDISYESR